VTSKEVNMFKHVIVTAAMIFNIHMVASFGLQNTEQGPDPSCATGCCACCKEFVAFGLASVGYETTGGLKEKIIVDKGRGGIPKDGYYPSCTLGSETKSTYVYDGDESPEDDSGCYWMPYPDESGSFPCV